MPKLDEAAFLAGYEFNLPLTDALNDKSMSIPRRMIAGASLKQGLNDAYYSAQEVLEAYRAILADSISGVSEDDGEGSAMIEHLLMGDGDDYQRRLHYILSEEPVAEAVADLEWLVNVLDGRAKMFRVFRERGLPMPLIPGYAGPIEDRGCRPFGH